jgi:hypothetical protein
MLKRALRATSILTIVVMLLWVLLIAAPMWLTRWRMSRLLGDYHSIYPAQSTWADAQRLMTRWGRWGRYEGTCTASDCDYSIMVGDEYSNWVDKLSEQNQERVRGSHVWNWLEHLGYRWSALSLHFQIQDGKIVRTHTLIHVDVEDSGPPDHWQYTLGISAQVRWRLASITRDSDRDPPFVLGADEQLALHPDYKVGRPQGCEGCEFDDITYAPTLPHDEAVRLTDFNLNCLTRLRACTTIGDLLPYGSGWHLYDGLRSNLYPTSGDGLLPCRTEARALARDAGAVVEVEVLGLVPDFKPYPNDERRHELVRARILHVWKGPIGDKPGSTIQVTPFAGEEANPPYWPAEAPEHLLPGHRALIFLTEDAATNFSPDPDKVGIVAYPLERCGVIEDTPANLAAVQLGVAQDMAYRHPLRDIGWW